LKITHLFYKDYDTRSTSWVNWEVQLMSFHQKPWIIKNLKTDVRILG